MTTSFLGGWIRDDDAVDAIKSEMQFPMLSQAGPEIKGTGKGKIALLYKFFSKNNISFPLKHQTVGDCVSQASAIVAETRIVTEISLGDNEKWVGQISTESIYYGSRIVVGKGRIRGDGSVGAWAMKFMHRDIGGCLFRKKYDFADLTKYNGNLARSWGSGKVPNGVIEECKKSPIDNYTSCENYEDVRDSIYNGYPVIVCSQQGFANKRDSDGFANGSGQWAHAMAFLGVDDTGSRPGVLCVNSWGPDWISGPKRHDQPDGSFWVDVEYVNKMCKMGDTWAVAGFNGFKKRPNMRII